MSEAKTSSDPALLGILALMAADRASADRDEQLPTELILDRVGVPRPDIARVVGKSEDATAKVIERARNPAAKAKAKKGGKK